MVRSELFPTTFGGEEILLVEIGVWSLAFDAVGRAGLTLSFEDSGVAPYISVSLGVLVEFRKGI